MKTNVIQFPLCTIKPATPEQMAAWTIELPRYEFINNTLYRLSDKSFEEVFYEVVKEMEEATLWYKVKQDCSVVGNFFKKALGLDWRRFPTTKALVDWVKGLVKF